MYNVSFPGFGWEFTINPVAFQIGNYKIYWYGIIIAAGMVLAMLYAFKTADRFEINKDKLFNCVIVGLIFGVIGARLYYVFFEWDRYAGDLLKIIQIHDGGLAIYGGIIGALVSGCLVAKLQKQKIMNILDLVALGFLIGQGIGRWGNFMNQEAFGTPTDLPWRMVSENTGGVGVHPCFLYESIWCLLGFVILHFVSKKFYKYHGQIFFMYMVWYGFERMIVEGLRTDSLYMHFSIFGYTPRVSQVLSFAIMILGIILLIIFGLRNKNKLKGAHLKCQE